ncbi:MAG: glutaredoxin domain-containing protein [Anaerolineaceae bacterium]
MERTKAKSLIVYGTQWCGDCRRTHKFLDSNKIEYTWIDIETDMKAQNFVREINQGNCSVPTIIFPDGSILVEPNDQELAEKLGIAKN